MSGNPSQDCVFVRVPLAAPWRELRIHEELVSTQDFAGARLDAGEDLTGVAIQARRQTKGRGRYARPWVSGGGGIYVTACLPRHFPAPWALGGWLPLAGALVCAQWVRETLRLPAEIKWPNDVLLEDRKIAGVLGEMRAGGCALLGLGLNWSNAIAQTGAAAGFRAASLAEWHPRLGGEDPLEFLKPWLAGLAQWAALLLDEPARGEEALARAAEELLWRRGETLRLEHTEQGAVEGKLVGLGAGGAARMRRPDGGIDEIQCGWASAV